MAINLPVLFVGNVPGNLRILLIELSVSFYKILAMGLAKTVLLGINESCLEKESPEGIHINLGGDRDMGVRSDTENVVDATV